ncbi:MAG TPA: hypothetical protein VHD15_11130 [Hyphomicrobiales bacterium]|nr:hypothetical protein [Hyphomicrobiales bacterium]
MNELLESLRRDRVIVGYETAPALAPGGGERLMIWVDAAVTEAVLGDVLQAVVDRSVETGSAWEVTVAIVVERASITPLGRSRPSDGRLAQYRN